MIRLQSLAIAAFLFLSAGSMSQSCGFEFSKLITIDHNQVSGSTFHSDFPVLISLTDTDLRHTGSGGNVTSTSGFDIAFLDEGSGEQLAHEIESYTSTTGNYIAWVKVPKVYGTVNTQIRMVYGNDEVTADPSTTATWDSDYQAVWHLHDDFNDATSVGNDGTNNGSTDATGFIADGQSFDGGDWINRTDATLNGNIPALSGGSPDAFTLSGWMQIDVLNARRPLLSKQGNGTGNDRGFAFMMESSNDLKIELFKDNVSGNRTEVYSSATLSTGTWYYVAVTYQFVTDGTSLCSLYIDGLNDGSTNTAVGPIFTNDRDLDIGRYFWQTGTEFYQDGLIDEVRISDVVRSADWIATEYANQNSPSTFYSLGNEENGVYTPSVPVCESTYKKIITIDNGEVEGGTDFTNFPVLLNFTDNDLRTVANGGRVQNANGWDIVFTDENLVSLNHELETYDPTTGEIVAWVKVPVLPTGTDYDIHMFYGNSAVFADPSSPCTWEEFYGVWHLHDDFLDSSPNDEDGTNNGSTDNTTSQIADGQSFDGGDFVEFTSFPNITTDFTITGWIQTTDNTEQGQRIFCDDEGTGGYALSLADGGTGRMRFFSRNMNNVIVDGTTNAISNNTWYYIAGVADITNQERIIFIDGVQDGADLTDTGTWGTDNGDASLGGETAAGETGNRFEGLLDEMRVSSVARSANWLLTEYNNQSSPGTFYSVGDEQLLTVATAQDGDWDATTTWSPDTVPTAGAKVTITHQVDMDDEDRVICNLTIASSSNVNARLEIENGNKLTVYEDVTMLGNGTGDVDVTLRTNNGNDVIQVNRDLDINQSDGDDIFIDVENAGDSVIVMGNVFFTHSGGDNTEFRTDNATAIFQVLGNVTLDLPDGPDDQFDIDLNAGLFTVGGFLDIIRTNGFSDLTIDLDGGDFTMDSLHISTADGDGGDPVLITIDEASTMTVTNGMFMEMGGGDDHEIEINGIAGTSGEFSVGGDLIWNKTDGDDINILVDDTDSEFNVTGKFVINSNGAEQITINMDNGSMTIGDSLIIRHLDGGQVIAIDMDGAANLTVDNLLFYTDENGSQDFFTTIDQTAQLNVTNDLILTIIDGDDLGISLGESVAASTAQLNVGNDLRLNHSTGGAGDDARIIISENCTGTVSGELVMTSDGASSNYNFYVALNDDAVFTVVDDITMTGGNGFGEVMIWLSDNSTLQMGGNLIRDAFPNDYGLIQSSDATTTIEYNGTGAQIFADEDGAGGDGVQYEQVIINNTFGTIPQLTMEDDVTLTNSITFTDGVLQTTSTELLTIANDATANGGNANSYVSGPLLKVGDDPFVFPIGKGATWARIEISDLINSPQTTDEFTAEYFPSANAESFWNPGDYAGDRGGLFNTSTVEYWELSRTGDGEPRVTLYWESNTASVITDTAELTVAHYVGASTWVDEGGNAAGALAAGSVTTTGNIGTFSPFTFGSTVGTENPLPVELIEFDAIRVNSDVLITWKTLTEANSDYYMIERSRNGKDWNLLDIVDGAGNSTTEIVYRTVDTDPYQGDSYYRLVQVDIDGKTSLSDVRRVFFQDAIAIYPNPVDHTLHFTSPISGSIHDAQGKLVLSFDRADHIDVSKIKAGIYFLSSGDLSPFKLIIE